MDPAAYRALGAREIAGLVGRGEVSAVEVVEASLAVVAERDGRIRAFREVWSGEARAVAAAVDRAVRRERLPLAGVPVGLKAWGGRSTPQARALVAAGCVPVGATSVPAPGTEWKTWGWTDRGPTVNPWRADRVPGGSSAGSAAAVAVGMVPLAAAADGAGSVRIPAAWCGVSGLKPTTGAVPATDPTGLAVPGPIARRAEDLRAWLEAVAGRPYPRTDHAGVTAAWSADAGCADTDPEVAEVASAAAGRLAAVCGVVLDAAPPVLTDATGAWQRVRSGGPAADGVNRDRLAAFFGGAQLLLTPTTPNRPHGHDGPDGRFSTALTCPFNLSGHPALSVPAGFTADGCPVGLQLVAAPGADGLLLDLAELFERTQPFSPPEWPSAPA
ncbi:amidase family protein [Kitasatospora paracochleata]|uniref:Asp-tRNA(Asn)/Glu-tRNA(Gln) amidotransferase A subunit family amidase n=3 Tax=Kitasatospora paracochleata TaxID=58354 RepID=A0ABT1IXA2_9ACTN|nr:amidase [Kitasatospora paracochleata]MCP2309780.1 Asp-tRNA(Asn)/Glu-tRNA(Gln) amidotransferase A subunit family amidase [Kitasatospora paracochleata]